MRNTPRKKEKAAEKEETGVSLVWTCSNFKANSVTHHEQAVDHVLMVVVWRAAHQAKETIVLSDLIPPAGLNPTGTHVPISQPEKFIQIITV